MPLWDGEIQAASIEQIRRGRDGKMHVISADAGSVASGLQQIDKGLKLRYAEGGNYYVVYYETPRPDGPPKQELVSTYQDLDQRIVVDCARIDWMNRQPGYSFADELEKKDREAEEAYKHKQLEEIGESAERMAFEARKALGYDQHKIAVKEGIKV